MKVVSRANLLNMKNLKISKIFKNVKLHLSRPAGAMTIHRFSKKVEFSERGRKSEIFGAKIFRRKKNKNENDDLRHLFCESFSSLLVYL